MIITKEHYKEYEKKNSFMYHNHIEIVQADKDCSIVKADLKQESMQVIIDEYVRLAKDFCDKDSYKLINGVLDKI